jgi:Domain of unknown function (DUF4440)
MVRAGAIALILAAPAGAEVPAGVTAALDTIRAAALSGKVETAAPLFAPELVLVSQSGKAYDRAAALADLGNGFVAWDNAEVQGRVEADTAVVGFVNRRQRPKMDAAAFRILQTWQQRNGKWLLVAQSSTAVAVTAPASDPALTPQTIIERAYAAAGGDLYRYPGTYHLHGVYLDYKSGPVPVEYKPYDLYRVQPKDHPRGRVADGKIRISAYKDGKPTMQIAFDGAKTYGIDGPTGEGADAPFWRTTMGFGMIRFALSPGYTTKRVADDLVDGKPAYTIRVTDPAGESAVFSVRIADARLVRVQFATPRGLHDRIFSEFFTKPGSPWVQPGRIRSFINGEKEAEFTYSDFTIGKPLPDDLFVIKPGQFPKDKR